ncbi:DUF1801 domain-containing protein [Microlunatus sp. Y2014]|uniref:DUF1801 domain-containing protein n=1 Tax=Microlunatus sp. Y2014 TaxID=3418488 RepID=UPI003DA7608A
MEPTPHDVAEFLERVTPERRVRDARTLLDLFGRVTGLEPELHGTIIGYGSYHYVYASGREGDAPAASFAPRKAATSIYLPDGIGAHTEALERLGPHTTGVGCLYLKDLAKVDQAVLEEIVATSYERMSSGTWTQRARDGV